MRFGLALDFGVRTRSIAEQFRRQLELINLAEKVGFESVWAGEGHAAGAFHLPSPLTVLAVLAPRTSLKLGTGVTLLPSWHPVRLAYDAAVLDQLSDGRLILGVGVGTKNLQKQFDWDPASIGERINEMLQALKLLWSGEAGFEGKHLHIEGGIAPLPVQAGGPPLWVGGSIRRSTARAAEFGDGYYAATNYSFNHIERQAEHYRAELLARNKESAQAVISVNRLTLVAERGDEALEMGAPHLGRILDAYARLNALGEGQPATRSSAEELFHLLRRDWCLVGTPDEVAQQVSRYAAAGVTHFQLRVSPETMPPEAAARTIELFGREVLPRFA